MLLKNITQDIVFEKLDEMLPNISDICTCERCKCDIMALALNNLPSRYVVTERGAIFTRVSSLDVQIAADTIIELTKAIERVRKEPRHEVHNDNKQ
jgi:competence protein ComFB